MAGANFRGVARRFLVLVTVVLVALMSLVVAPVAANAASTAALALSKTAMESGTSTPLTTPVAPGGSFDYQLSAACSGLTEGCINAKTVDVIPAGIDIQVPPSLPPLYTVAYVPATRTLTITYTDTLASPPNPAGSRGIVAGSTRVATIHATLRADTTAQDGSKITNTATATADNADTQADSAPITVAVPRSVLPVASKSMSSSALIAQSEASTIATLGVRNASSSAAEVTALGVADTSKNTWDDFDLVSVGPVARFPAGADQVSVQYCTQPAPCTPAQFLAGPFVPGPAISLPSGVDPSTVTGIGFVFSNSAGTVLPVDTTGGQVPVELALRNTVRSTGAQLDPTAPLAQQNCATPSGTDTVDGLVTGSPACAPFTIQPGAAKVAVSKSFFPDAAGTFSTNGYAVGGQDSPVSALTTGVNASAFPVTNLTLTEPSPTSTSNFADLDTSSLRLVFPSGATAAAVTVTCRDGIRLAPVTVTAPPTTANLASTGCPPASPPSKVSVAFTGNIVAGASAQLGLHGTLNSGAAAGTTISDCSDGSITGGTQGSAAGTGCANLPVQTPRTTVSGVKNFSSPGTGGALVAGQPMTFTLQATNSGNLPQTGFTLTDPDPGAPNLNPFAMVRLTSAKVSTTPAALAGQFVIEVLDGVTWVPYSATDTALLTRATGIRARLASGSVLPTNRVTLTFGVLVRDGVPDGSTLTNCQRTSVVSVAGAGNSGSKCAAALTVAPAQSAGQVSKLIVPSSVARPIAGVPPQVAHVRLQVSNTGNLPMNQLVVSDPDPARPDTFFDAVDFTAFDGINFPPGANRVEVEACTSPASCRGEAYHIGVPSTVPILPIGVTASDVQGLRFTFTNSGRYVLNPGSNFPNTGACPNATVCFSVTPRLSSRADPSKPIPAALSNIATAGGATQLSGGRAVSFGSAPAPLAITDGTIQLGTTKTAVPSSVGPGTPVTYTLKTSNTGTGSVPALAVTDPVPAGLVFDATFAGDAGQPFTMTSSVPAGTPPVPQPTFTPVLDPTTHNLTRVTWQFPANFAFLPGSSVSFAFHATLAPGTSAGQKVSNTFGAATADPAALAALTCAQGEPDPTLGCTASALVTAQSGSAVDAQKWVHGDDSRGFYNTRTMSFVPIGDASCPLLVVGGDNFTRFPCIGLVLAGQDFSFLLNLTNVGTTPATQTRIVDDLPKIGDRGVIVPSARGTEWDPRPTLTGAPFLVAGKPGALSSLGYSSAGSGCTSDLARPPKTCPAGSWSPTYSAGAQSFRTFIDFATPLQPAQSTQIIVPMSAPTNLDKTATSVPIAWNSFAHTDFFRQGNGSITQLQAVEPIKVGVGMPFGMLQIQKVLTGDIPPGSVIGPFRASYTCTITPARGADVTVAEGKGTFSVGAALTVPRVPVGASCKVWETDTGGGNADHPINDPFVTTITRSQSSGPTIAPLTNDFPAPRLIVTKAIRGDAAGYATGPYVISVDCQLAGAQVDGYPRDLTFDAAGSQSITDLPIGATCTVREPDDRGATAVATTYSNGDHADINALVDGVATVSNTYDPANLTVTKTVSGPGSAGPFTFGAACVMTSNAGTTIPLTLPAADATFSLAANQSHALTVPTGAACTVTETHIPAGDTPTYDGQPTATPVSVDGATGLSILNTFAPVAPPSSTVPPPSTTPPPSSTTPPPPSANPGPPNGGNPAPPNGGNPTNAVGGLPFTGTNLLLPLGVGLVLIAGGFLLWYASRRGQNLRH